MRILKFSLFLCLCFFLQTSNLSAFSIGRMNQTYVANHVIWQKVHYEDEKGHMQAAIPGDPCSGFSNDYCFIYSDYGNSYYQIHLNPYLQFKAPAKVQEFLAMLNPLPAHTKAYVVKPPKPHIRYAIELHTYNDAETQIEKVMRVYATNSQVYYMYVLGSDLSIAYDFLNSIEIFK